jgi:magnesium chelatase subunit D
VVERRRRVKLSDRGRYIRAVAARGGKIAFEATLRAALGAGRKNVTGADLRFKQFQRKSGVLIVFCVDTSGSMAFNRLSEAKGAVLELLQGAYVHRDQVALIAFGGRGAHMLLPPTRSVDRARRAIEAVPAGGGTPLAAGLSAALELRKRAEDVLLVLITDGRANVASGAGDVGADLERACAAVRGSGIASVVIDTVHRFALTGDAERIAQLLAGRYLRLPEPHAHTLYEAVSAEAGALHVRRPGGL